MDDATLIKLFVERFQRLPYPEGTARNVAPLVSRSTEIVAHSAMPFDSEASTFLPALEADDDGR